MRKEDLIEGSLVLIPDNCIGIKFTGGQISESIHFTRTTKTVEAIPINRDEVQVGLSGFYCNPDCLEGVSLSEEALLCMGFQRTSRVINGYVYDDAFSFHDNVYVIRRENTFFVVLNNNLVQVGTVHELQKKVFDQRRFMLLAKPLDFNTYLELPVN